jgi:cell division protein FtsW (lipid II flippase)
MSSYYRFWWRTCVVMCPLIFFVLYASGVALKWVLLSTVLVAVVGLLLVLPFILAFGSVDRDLWSQDEYIKRRLRYKQKLSEYDREYEDEDDLSDEEEQEDHRPNVQP